MAPSTGAVVKTHTTSNVPAARASSGAGIRRPIRTGRNNTIARLARPAMTASLCAWTNACPMPAIAARVPPGGLTCPSRGASCKMMMMQPMPVMNPEITGYGMRLM
jgi:hypothetical protein